MKIGFDISQTGKIKAGCGYFADGMIQRLTRLPNDCNYVLCSSFGDFFFDAEIAQSSQQIDGAKIAYGPRHHTLAEATEFWRAPNLDQRLGVDIVQSNNYWCPRQLKTTRLIYTLYDLSFLEQPSWTTETNRNGCFYGVFGAATAADWIVSISHASRAHFLRIFPSFPPERVKVVFPASRFDLAADAPTQPHRLKGVATGDFWLSVGTIEPRKNHERLLQGYAGYLARGGTAIPLVLAGGSGWLMEDFSARIAKLGLTDHVILTGYVSDAELRWLYENCRAHVYISLFEGFGLPVLEGMELGAPTIASSSTSIPEITGEAAILVDPLDVEGLAQALLTLADNIELRGALSERARAQAREFQWERSARQLADIYRLAYETPKRRCQDGR